MSCNPSIGGIGKGHLVKEIDALGGAMAIATDEAGIQFRTLNASKGPAVRATRAQADRVLYRAAIRRRLEYQPNLWLFQSAVDDLILDGERVAGAVTADGAALPRGDRGPHRRHVPGRPGARGPVNYPAGRAGDPPSLSLAARLRELKLPVGRLKTGTPPRIDGRTIDFSKLVEQPGDRPEPVFSFMGSRAMHPRQVPCWITHTNERTHEIIRGGLDRSPMFTGVIEGVGPRYCPSIEDKIHRFAGKASHQIFLEPEGLTTHEFYPNGISTSLPFDVQLALVRSIQGLEHAHILRPGYAIEYDYFDPRGLKSTLETKAIAGLFFAGPDQRHHGLRGGRGAGAARRHQRRPDGAGRSGLVPAPRRGLPGRPGRRPDHARRVRALPHVHQPRRVPPAAARGQRRPAPDRNRPQAGPGRRCALEGALRKARSHRTRNRAPQGHLGASVKDKCLQNQIDVLGQPIEREHSLFDLLRRPNVTYAALKPWMHEEAADSATAVAEQVEIAAKYAGYIERQKDEIERQRSQEISLRCRRISIIRGVRGLSKEAQQKLNQHRPETVGQASRIQGVTPAAISLLLVHLQAPFARPAGPREARMSLEAQIAEGLAAMGIDLPAPARARLAQHLRAHREMEPRAQPHRGARDRRRWSCCIFSTAFPRCRIWKARDTILDVGTGPGLPGIPLAIARPDAHVTLLDSSHKKCAFLQQAKTELGLDNVTVVCDRVEQWQSDTKFDAVVSRAFAELAEFVTQARHLVAPGGLLIAMKGVYPFDEIARVPSHRVARVLELHVPKLDAKRHLVFVEAA